MLSHRIEFEGCDRIRLDQGEPRYNPGTRYSRGHDSLHPVTLSDEISMGSENSHRESKKACAEENHPFIFSTLVFLIGCLASAAFLGFGITKLQNEQNRLFASYSTALVIEVELVWKEYLVATLWIHAACRKRSASRLRFAELYEHLRSTGIVFQSITFSMNVTNEERESLESEATAYYQEISPDLVYHGFVGLESVPGTTPSLTIQPRSVQPFYLVNHFVEPLRGNNTLAADFDLVSAKTLYQALQSSAETGQPVLTIGLQINTSVFPGNENGGFHVVLFHPGIVSPDFQVPRDFSSMTMSINDLIKRILKFEDGRISFYIYDTTDHDTSPQFLGGGATVITDTSTTLIYFAASELAHVRESAKQIHQRKLIVGLREWTIVVADVNDTFKPNLSILIMGGVFIFITCTTLALGIYIAMKRSLRINRMTIKAKAEQAALIVDNAMKSAQAERNLNDFIAHEVRNPLAAAISACAFVTSAVNEEVSPLLGAEKEYESVREDLIIVDSSLLFIKDLLQNMLDMHRNASNQLKLEMAPSNLMRDVLQPVDSMLYRRGENWQLVVECPNNLVVMTDCVRLKQIVLNLSRNAAKFVDHGFILLRATVVNGMVQISVEDSGPGIPQEKQEDLFAKFQESFDSLSQGTGLGLSFCKSLVERMGGNVRLDRTYDSGIQDCPGARFVISLNLPPLDLDDVSHEATNQSLEGAAVAINEEPPVNTELNNQEEEWSVCLAQNMAILMVDDDPVLRKLFNRSVKGIAPAWDIQEASNGETAMELVDLQHFDIIFMDQYMASPEKRKLLGTETTYALRAKGVTSIICGLSANDVQQEFLDAGANSFVTKPFPCKKIELRSILLKILSSKAESPG